MTTDRKAYLKKWRQDNAEVLKAKARARYIKDPEKAKSRSRIWGANNKDKVKIRRSTSEYKARKNAKTREKYKETPQAFLEASRSWRKANPEAYHKSNALYYSQHQLENNLKSRLWRKANPDKVKAAWDRWHKQNKELYREQMCSSYNRRRARLHSSDSPGVTVAEWKAILEYFGYVCAYCLRTPENGSLTRDHIIALSRGGLDEPSNVVPACRSCNSKKRDKRIFTLL